MALILWKVLHFARVWLCFDALASLGIFEGWQKELMFLSLQSKSLVFLAKFSLAKSKSCAGLIFEGWQKSWCFSFCKARVWFSLQTAKLWEVDFWRQTWINSVQPCKIQELRGFEFWRLTKNTDVFQFAKQEFGFPCQCKSLGSGFLAIFEWAAFNPCNMQKLAMVDFWRVILAKFWSRSCRSNLACFSFCNGRQIEMPSEKCGWVLHFARIEFSWIFKQFHIFLRPCFAFCRMPGATFSICWPQNVQPSPTLVIFEGKSLAWFWVEFERPIMQIHATVGDPLIAHSLVPVSLWVAARPQGGQFWVQRLMAMANASNIWQNPVEEAFSLPI